MRLSLDAKAPVLIGPFSRRSYSRLGTEGADQDFRPWGRLTPFGIFLPDQKDLSLYFTHSKVTSDFIVDRLDEWWREYRWRHPQVRELLLDLDNGPENSSRRTQFVCRLVLRALAVQWALELVYYPPYHSKYNPIEWCWGVLEVYWNGSLLDSEEAVLSLAANMRYAGKHPAVRRVSQDYRKAGRRGKEEMSAVEMRLARSSALPRWHLTLAPAAPGRSHPSSMTNSRLASEGTTVHLPNYFLVSA